jgi:hypothetical protein
MSIFSIFDNYIFFQIELKKVLNIAILNIIRKLDEKLKIACNREILFNDNVMF